MADVTYIIVPAIFSRECPRHATYRADLASMVADEGYAPSDEQDDGCTDGRGKVRIYGAHTHLGEYRVKGRKKSRQDGVILPHGTRN